VAVAVSMPTPRPVTSRATSSTGNGGSATNSTAAASSRASAASRTFLRPTTSDRWPASSRLVSTPTAYPANTIVTVKVEKPSRAWYSGYSGVGTVENAKPVRNTNAISQNPAP
jgi:hypothetical protein